MVFQQDNARPHTANVYSVFQGKQYYKMLFPANSPDLNQIEHIGKYMNRKTRANNPQYLGELAYSIADVWVNALQGLLQTIFVQCKDA